MPARFDGMTAAVTGGANGIGRAVAAGFLGEGANVVRRGPRRAARAAARAALRGGRRRRGRRAGRRAGGRHRDRALRRPGRARERRRGLSRRTSGRHGPRSLAAGLRRQRDRRLPDVPGVRRHRIAAGGGGRIVSISSGSARSPRPEGIGIRRLEGGGRDALEDACARARPARRQRERRRAGLHRRPRLERRLPQPRHRRSARGARAVDPARPGRRARGHRRGGALPLLRGGGARLRRRAGRGRRVAGRPLLAPEER